MKKYRVFIIDMGCLPKRASECMPLIKWGIANIDGHFGPVFMKHPIAAHARIISEVAVKASLSQTELKRKIISSPCGIYFARIRNSLNNYISFLDWLEDHMLTDAVFMLIGRYKEGDDGFLLIRGRDVMAVNMGTLDNMDSVLSTAEVLAGAEIATTEFSKHIIFSDYYLQQNGVLE